MKQVKVIIHTSSNGLEKQVNKFLEECEMCRDEIENIQYQTVKEGAIKVYSAMVVYETI